MPAWIVACRRLLATLVSSPLSSRLVGRLADLRLPAAVLARAIRIYARAYGVDLREAERPPEAYARFNDFFTRRLTAGCRPIDGEAGVVVSPSDSELVSFGPVPPDLRLEQIKGSDYSLEALLGSAAEARSFSGGVHATLYLSPAMYHRVHAPVDGRVRQWRYVPGRLFPVNRLGVSSIPGLFTRNERVVVSIDSEAFGPVAVVMVGAMNVGRISLAFADLVSNRGLAGGSFRPEQPIVLRRGDELGTFNLGSTVVLLLADGSLAPIATPGQRVRMGQPLWRRVGRAATGAVLLALAAAVEAAPAPAVRPGTVVRWPGSAIESCALAGRRFEPLDGACYYPIDLLQRPGPLELVRRRGGRAETARIRVARFDYPLQRLTLPRHLVDLSPEDLRRVRRENAEVRPLWRRDGARRFALPLAAPLEPLPAGGRFGVRRRINGRWRSPHAGADFAAPAGTPVWAAADGVVAMVADHFFSGHSVFLDHGDGLISTYFHLSRVEVAAGQPLRRGERLGAVGQSGRATGPHLHFGLRWRGARVNPELLLGDPARILTLD